MRLMWRRRRNGQIIPIFALSAPMWLALLGLLIAGGFLITEKISLDSATELATLAGASQISVSAYEKTGAIQLESFTQPNADPCNQSDTTNYNRLLCSVQTALCSNFNHDTTPNYPNAVANCTNNTNASCQPPAPGVMEVSVCDVFTTGTNGPCSVADYPMTVDELNYCVFMSDSGQILNVQSWYTYPNPIGDIFVSQLHASSLQLAQKTVTPCTNGTTTC